MRQILFEIPLEWLHEGWRLPVFGYGLMLFLAYLLCTALAKRLCKHEGIDPALIPDLAIWLFVAGIIGGRTNFVIQYWRSTSDYIGFDQKPLVEIVKLWDGGLVLYGAIFGGTIGYFAYDHFVMRKKNVSKWKMLDVIAPCVALGVALGRIGCLCTGCCYGNVACSGTPSIEFPVYANTNAKSPEKTAPASEMIKRDYQSPFGFMLEPGTPRVAAVEMGSAAERAGLKVEDMIFKINDDDLLRPDQFVPRDGKLKLDVMRDGAGTVVVEFTPTSVGLNPTQIYETISMSLLLFMLLSYFPYKRRDGELMVILMICYAVHRFLNEMLRTDTSPVWGTGLTYSQNTSILVLLAAGVLAWFVWRRPVDVPNGT